MITKHKSLPRPHNLSREQFSALRDLRDQASSGPLRITKSDKGDDFVILPKTLEKSIVELHLSDLSLHTPTIKLEFARTCDSIHRHSVSICKK